MKKFLFIIFFFFQFNSINSEENIVYLDVQFIIDNSDEVKVTPELYRWGKIRLEERNAELYLISGHGNIGYGRGHNLVLNRIDSDFHLLLNEVRLWRHPADRRHSDLPSSGLARVRIGS